MRLGKRCSAAGVDWWFVVNIRRVAALLRELADVLEQPDPQARPKRRPIGPAPVPVSPEAIIKVQRKLRRLGIAS
jgi:hypothetical protein